eukprot:TRINITY_DN3856_c0_g1_i2.p1 TRINITY_DN3856_c0_g1~~TRINITY_DN3856_c0_g1_i2.p1  ORF type:complete len:172 (+),score=17.13 TRINITY_DN3856_c0_g1_i2:99-614(+)
MGNKYRKINKMLGRIAKMGLPVRSMAKMVQPPMRSLAMARREMKFAITARTNPNSSDTFMTGLRQHKSELLIDSPLEILLGTLCSCMSHTAHHFAKPELNINIKSLKFPKVEAVGPFPKFENITLVCEVVTDGTHEQVDKLAQLVSQRCPVHLILHDSGIKFDEKWIKVEG